MKVKIKPLGSRVLVRRLGVEEQVSSSGLVIPPRGPEPTYVGKVIAAGPDAPKDIQTNVKVLMTPHTGDEVRLDRENLWLVDAAELLAIIRD